MVSTPSHDLTLVRVVEGLGEVPEDARNRLKPRLRAVFGALVEIRSSLFLDF